jgi:hypothetical protein
MTAGIRVNRRFLACLALALLLGGPTPGAVGSCGEEDEFVELIPYCEEREQLICYRQYLRGELGSGDRGVEKCRRDAVEACRNRRWAPGCRPTERQARACINALEAVDTLDTPESEIDECSDQALCRVREEAPAGAGEGGGEG